MSIILNGVKDPADCAECFLWPICPCLVDFDDYSSILEAVRDGNLVRCDGCPISSLPEKHGRLIDADALRKEIDANRPGRIYEDGWSLTVMNHAPTIVPAEGGGE